MTAPGAQPQLAFERLELYTPDDGLIDGAKRIIRLHFFNKPGFLRQRRRDRWSWIAFEGLDFIDKGDGIVGRGVGPQPLGLLALRLELWDILSMDGLGFLLGWKWWCGSGINLLG